ncbi:CapA family protein [Leucobacter ruminantium]|uniref:CapA family protein n=1 Tax=Leucobacter ruminantium TaxID=1289170 RepID=A0A939LXB8_9MICO|nr:CapA family protein [Leucobacter ruminantium]MBO1804873.1 CapA family protein [Leucobacter ruminantium]
MNIIGAGDMIFGSRHLRDRFDPAIVELFDRADAVFANAEFTMPKETTPAYPHGYTLGNHRWAAAEMRELGISLVSGANNHTGDYGHVGVIDTLEAFAEQGLELAGVGRTLSEARQAIFADTAQGRVALVATSTSGAAEFRASDAGRDVAARPGLNPLRWQVSYELASEQFEQILAIEAALGIDATHRETDRIEIRENLDPDLTAFGSVPIRRRDTTRLRWDADRGDLAEICRAIVDASATGDTVIVSLHAHEGERDGWYSDQPAEFIVEAAHAMVDAGAHAVFGHGPHMLRGIEVYRGAPIFYSLNGLTFDLESGYRVPVEMFEKYGHPANAYPSDLHGARRRGADGARLGFYSQERFSQAVLAELVTDEADGSVLRATLHPLDLQMNSERRSLRGMPRLASGDSAERIVSELARMSEPFGTRISFDAETGLGTVDLAAP